MPAFPVVNMGRIVLPYTISGLTHKIRMYVKHPTLSGSDYIIGDRTGGTPTISAAAAADDLSKALSHILPTGTVFGTALLEKYDGVLWNPVQTFAVTGSDFAGSAVLAGETTVTFRATDFFRPKLVILEAALTGPAKYTSPTAGPANLDAFLAEFTAANTLANGPYNTMVNNRENFLAVAPIVSTRVTSNRKLERARGLA